VGERPSTLPRGAWARSRNSRQELAYVTRRFSRPMPGPIPTYRGRRRFLRGRAGSLTRIETYRHHSQGEVFKVALMPYSLSKSGRTGLIAACIGASWHFRSPMTAVLGVDIGCNQHRRCCLVETRWKKAPYLSAGSVLESNSGVSADESRTREGP